MIKALPTVCFFMSAIFSFNAKADTVLYCSTELSPGLIKENSKWRTGNFRPERYTVKFNRDFSRLSGLDDNRDYTCHRAFKNDNNKTVICFSGYHNGEVFMYNIRTNRFLFSNFSSTGGYVSDDGTEPNPDTDNIFAGTCSNF